MGEIVAKAWMAGISLGSALARLETALHLVDHVNPALAADQTVVAVTAAQRFQGVTDLHGNNPDASKGRVEGRT